MPKQRFPVRFDMMMSERMKALISELAEHQNCPEAEIVRIGLRGALRTMREEIIEGKRGKQVA